MIKYSNKETIQQIIDESKARLAPIEHTHKKSEITDLTVDSSLSSTSTNPVQNKVVKSALDGKVPNTRTVNDKPLSANITLSANDVGADASGTAETKANAVQVNLDSHEDNTTIHTTSDEKTKWNTAYTHSQASHARTDATKVTKSTTNGNILINGTETVVYTHPSGTNPHGTTKSDVGLGNVNNTSDANKPVSTAQQAAIDEVQENVDTVQTNLDALSDEVTDHVDNADIHFTVAERTKLSGIATGANKYTHPSSGVTAGTYKSVTVNAQGHVTGGTNPTTLSGYGITDAEAKGTAQSKVGTHNTSTSCHNDIRDLITALTTRLNTIADSDDTTLDQMSEIVAYIKANKELIESITTTKVNVSDIINNLTTNVSNKPLSAAQGVAIKALIDALQDEVDSHTHDGRYYTESEIDTKLSGKANTSHGNHVPATETANNAKFLRNDNTWQIVTPANIGAAASSHGTHVSYSSTAPVMDGTASVGTATTVSRSDHKHPTDTSRAAKTDFDSHASDTTKHITSTERTNWNAAKTHADSAHAPSNAEKNQNAFSNVKVGDTTIAADTATDTLTLVGSNVTLTPDATNDKVTIAVASGSTSTAGIVKLTNSTSSTSTTTAATPNSVKSAYDLANTAKTNAATAQTRADSAYSLAESKVDSLSDLGITATATELNYMDGATSNVQTQLDTINEELDGSIKSLSVSGKTITYTKNDGSTGTITTQDTNTDTKVTNTLATTTKAYVTGTTSSSTNTGTQVFDTGVYLDTIAGQLRAKTYKVADLCTIQADSTNECINFVFV